MSELNSNLAYPGCGVLFFREENRAPMIFSIGEKPAQEGKL
jgi:hypothetical protein